MAKFTVGDGYAANFDTVPLATANGDITIADDHLIRIATAAGDGRPAGFENYIGTFTYNAEGLPLGDIRVYRFNALAGDMVFRIGKADISVLGLRKAAEQQDPQAFLELIFRHDDKLEGGALADLLRGYDKSDRLDGRGGDDMLYGMSGKDRLKGQGGDDTLAGGRHADGLRGGVGEDWLDGGAGRDRLVGGTGDDVFVFRHPNKPDRIKDFAEGDRIALGFDGLGPSGPLDPAAFHRGASAKSAGQKILYDAKSGWLLYAEDGAATPKPIPFAKVGKHIDHLGADDFFIL